MSLRETLRNGAQLPEAFSKKFLLGRAFTIYGWREIEVTNKGKTKIARLTEITLDGNDEHVEGWVTGAVIDRQLDELVKTNSLPARVKLGWSSQVENAYELTDADDELNEVTQMVLGAPDKPKRPRR